MSAWKKFRHRLEAAACRGLAAVIPRLSRRTVLGIGSFLGGAVYYLDARGRGVAHENLICVFGGRFGPMDRWRIALASYQNFARTMLSLFWAQRFEHEDYSRWMEIDGFRQAFERAKAEGRGVIFLGEHFGNWEWSNLACGFSGIRALAIAQEFKNPALDPVFSRPREVSGMRLIGREGAALKMFREIKRGGAAALLLDLTQRPSQATAVIDVFGGLKMCVSMLHGLLVERTRALVGVCETDPRPDGTCEVTMRLVDLPEGATPQEVAQRCWDAFEPMIHRRPELWLWAYKHFRYKPKRADRQYPSYAHESGAFERVMRESAAAKSS